MKCKDCDSCRKGFWASKPDAYICIGVQEPFEILDIESECTEYARQSQVTQSTFIKKPVFIKQHLYIDENGIYMPVNEYVHEGCEGSYRLVLSKEMFVEAYNKWIKDSHIPLYKECVGYACRGMTKEEALNYKEY